MMSMGELSEPATEREQKSERNTTTETLDGRKKRRRNQATGRASLYGHCAMAAICHTLLVRRNRGLLMAEALTARHAWHLNHMASQVACHASFRVTVNSRAFAIVKEMGVVNCYWGGAESSSNC